MDHTALSKTQMMSNDSVPRNDVLLAVWLAAPSCSKNLDYLNLKNGVRICLKHLSEFIVTEKCIILIMLFALTAHTTLVLLSCNGTLCITMLNTCMVV